MVSSQLVLQTAGLTSKVLEKFAKMLAVGLHLLAISFGLLAVPVATSMNVCVFLVPLL